MRIPALNTFLRILLAVSIAIPQLAWAQQGPSDPQPPREKPDAFLEALISARNEQIAPPRLDQKTANLYFMLSQDLRSNQGSLVNLATSALELPGAYIGDVNASISYEIQNGNFTLRSKADGRVQIISGIDALQWVEGKNQIFILSADKSIYAISKSMIKNLVFSSPIPVFEIGKVEDPFNAKLEVMSGKTTFAGIAEYLQADLARGGIERPAVFAGDLVVLDQRDVLRAHFDLGYLAQKMMIDTLVLSLLAVSQNPQLFQDERWIQDTLREHQSDLEQITRLLDTPIVKEAMKSQDYLDSLARLPRKAIDSSLAKMQNLRRLTQHGPQREQILISNAIRSLQAHRAQLDAVQSQTEQASSQLQAVQAASDRMDRRMAATIKTFGVKLSQVVQTKTVKRLSFSLLALAGGASVDYLTGSHASSWLVSFVAQRWHSAVPEILLSPTWRWPTMRTTLLLAGTVPFVFTIGKIASAFTGWDVKKTIMIASLRTYGAIQGSFYLLMRALNQRNLFPAVKEGVNPLTEKGVLNFPWESLKKLAENQVRVGRSVDTARHISALSWLLAHQSLISEQNLDPLSLLAAQVELAKSSEGRNLSITPSEWAQLARELREELEKMANDGVDLRSLDDRTLMEMIVKADDLRTQLSNKPQILQKARVLSGSIREFWRRATPKAIGNMGYDVYRRLMSAEPSDAVSRHALRVYSVNYLFGVAFASFFGARANLAKPENLVANPYGADAHPTDMMTDSQNMLGINPSHLTDAANENLRWNTVRRASLWMTFDSASDKTSYLPTDETLPMPARTATFMETARDFAKSAVNLKRANYGYYFYRNLSSTVETALAGLLIGVSMRAGILGQPLLEALPAQLWSMGVSIWMYGWFGIAINRMVIMHEQEVESRAAELRDIQVRIQQGLDRQDAREITESYNRLLKIYRGSGKSSRAPIPGVEVTQDEVQALLNDSISNSPVATRANEKFMAMITLAGAVTIAFLAEAYSVTAFGQHADWVSKMVHGWSTSLLLYFGIYGAQKAINSVWSKIEEHLLKKRPKEEPITNEVRSDRDRDRERRYESDRSAQCNRAMGSF